ncbi:FIST C-terminal domain-containing protein [bacterium]|nr:FIST C-terminal domain-containing protein [bacterium]MBU1753546.1 FIST C-terminal domain-containing protein [bacterium]
MYFPTTDAEEIVNIVCGMEIRDTDVVLILLGERNMPDVTRMISGLNKNGVNFFGGMFPGLIYDDKKYEQGAVIKVLPALASPYLIKGLDTEQIELCQKGSFPDFISYPNKKYTAMVLVDGLTSNIALFLSELFDRLGNSVSYFGGGAGSLTLKQQPCLFTSQGFVQDAAVVTFIKAQCNIGVSHGWKKLVGPIVANKTCKNVIMELNWKGAFEAYQEIVEADSGVKLSVENFYAVAMRYPFGIYKEGAEDIVRDPIMANEKGELICVGEVPEHSLLNILKGETDWLIQAAGKAAKEACGKEIHCNLVADCISRTLFLGEDFAGELAIVKENLVVTGSQGIPAGMLTLGEISSYGETTLEFFNKTIVIGGCYE